MSNRKRANNARSSEPTQSSSSEVPDHTWTMESVQEFMRQFGFVDMESMAQMAQSTMHLGDDAFYQMLNERSRQSSSTATSSNRNSRSNSNELILDPSDPLLSAHRLYQNMFLDPDDVEGHEAAEKFKNIMAIAARDFFHAHSNEDKETRQGSVIVRNFRKGMTSDDDDEEVDEVEVEEYPHQSLHYCRRHGRLHSEEDPGDEMCSYTSLSVPDCNSFLEASLYFSSVSQTLVKPLGGFKLDQFFAPPLLFQDAESISSWSDSLKSLDTNPQEIFNQYNSIQPGVAGLFALSLLPLPGPDHIAPFYLTKYNFIVDQDRPKPTLEDMLQSRWKISTNYFNCAISAFAMAIMDNLSAGEVCHSSSKSPNDSSMIRSETGAVGKTSDKASKVSAEIRARTISSQDDPLVNQDPRRLAMSSLRVPTLDQVISYWCTDLTVSDRKQIAQDELDRLQKFHMELPEELRNECMCCSCSKSSARSIRWIYETFYQYYIEDVGGLCQSDIKSSLTEEELVLKQRKRLRFYALLASLGLDLANDRSTWAIVQNFRLSESFDSSEDPKCCPHHQDMLNPEDPCKQCLLADEPIEDDVDDDDDEEEEDAYREIATAYLCGPGSSFFTHYSQMDDEGLVLAEEDLPIDPAHLTTSTLHSYYSDFDSRVPNARSLRRVCFLSDDQQDQVSELTQSMLYNAPTEENQSSAVLSSLGKLYYQALANLLFQFSVATSMLKASTSKHQQKLLEELEMELLADEAAPVTTKKSKKNKKTAVPVQPISKSKPVKSSAVPEKLPKKEEVVTLSKQPPTNEIVPLSKQISTNEIVTLSKQLPANEIVPLSKQLSTNEIVPLSKQPPNTEIVPLSKQPPNTEIVPLSKLLPTSEVVDSTDAKPTAIESKQEQPLILPTETISEDDAPPPGLGNSSSKDFLDTSAAFESELTQQSSQANSSTPQASISPQNLTGEAPDDVLATGWFDKILGSAMDSIWSPLAPAGNGNASHNGGSESRFSFASSSNSSLNRPSFARSNIASDNEEEDSSPPGFN